MTISPLISQSQETDRKDIFLRNIEVLFERYPEYLEKFSKESDIASLSNSAANFLNFENGWRIIEDGKLVASQDTSQIPPISNWDVLKTRKSAKKFLMLGGFGVGEIVDRIIDEKIPFDYLIVVEPLFLGFS